ncbi:MAG: uncharacterized protein QOG80_3224 [Pseudonocardiales bacterium]|jgi:uncharacterized membrane protein (UPF0182 family)|nr:uncharacterized protein [Pseudonocardiales bacterium]
MRPPIPSLTLSRRWKIALFVVAVLIVLLIIASSLTGVYVNWLWFGEVGYRSVYRTMLWTKIILFLIFGFLMALIIGGNLVAAYLLRPPFRPMSAEQQNLERYRVMIEPRKWWILGGISAIAWLAAGLSAMGRWQTWQLWLHGGSFGIKDPLFHRDVSFFAWDYPTYRLMLGFGFTALIFALILTIAVHYLSGAIRLQTPGPKITPAARRHLTIIIFVFMVLKALAYWLDRYGLVFSNRSKFTGASYTDVHASLQSKTILFWLALIIAAGVLASLWLRSALLPGIGIGVLLVLSILISGVYPAILQQVSVKPNASDKERTYIGRNITATRQAYDIVTQTPSTPNGTVSYQDYPVTTTPSATALTTTNPTIDNIRILDPNVVSPTFTALQRIKNPYGFNGKLDMDRYQVNGTYHDYVVGARELSPSNLTGSQGNWINLHTVYTHGYGFVAAEADTDVTKNGNFSAGDINPTTPSSGPLALTTPQVYYGELLSGYSIVGAKGQTREYDGADQTTTYAGKGGVSLGSFVHRLAFAVHYKQTNFLLNNVTSTSGARLIFNRDPKQRVEKVAPFLTVDGDPYPVVSNGRLVWIVDAYTTMSNFPYSQQSSLSSLTHTSVSNKQQDKKINYIRNSVKATVDAYDGTVTLYQWQDNDPVLNAWEKIFPGIVKPKTSMPQTIMQHVRYPEDLFDVQRSLLEQYHVDDPVTFYNVRDKWTVPSDPNAPSAGDQPPYYVLAQAPGSTTTQFQLTTPMLVNNSTNLAAYISADSDPDNYGHITILKVTNASAIQGPEQIANDFKTETHISKDISLLNQGQSAIIHGNLLTLPVGGTFLYVEPLYVQSSFPTLRRVLVSYGSQIGYGATLSDALSDLQPGHTTGQTIDSTASNPTPTPTPTTPLPPGTGSGTPTPTATSQAALIAALNKAFSDLQAAYRSGDLQAIGTAQAQVQKLVQQYESTYGTSASPTPSPTRTK